MGIWTRIFEAFANKLIKVSI